MSLTTDGDEVQLLTEQFPKRWHVRRVLQCESGPGLETRRYAEPQHTLRTDDAGPDCPGGHSSITEHRLGKPVNDWDADHLAKHLFQGLDGDVRVKNDTIIVTYCNLPTQRNRLRLHYEGLPEKLHETEHGNPGIPWLYGFKLDFRFR